MDENQGTHTAQSIFLPVPPLVNKEVTINIAMPVDEYDKVLPVFLLYKFF